MAWGPQRVARHDLSGLSPARARETLARLEPAIEAAVARFSSWGQRVGLEPDDLRQFARLAVLDAAVTHDKRAKLDTWAKRLIRWRLTEALTAAQRPEEPLEDPNTVLNGQNPQELVERLQVVHWVRGAVDGLSVRRRTIIACRLRGESYQEIAVTLGISRTRVHQEAMRAAQELRDKARKQRLDESEPDS